MKTIMYLFIFLSSVNRLWGIEISQIQKNREFGISLKNINYSKRFIEKTIYDGLPHDIFYEVKIFNGKKEIIKKSYLVKFVYDLWDEVFKVYFNNQKQIFSKSEFLDFVNNLKALRLSKLSHLNNGSIYTIDLGLYVDPIKRKQLEKIRTKNNSQNSRVSLKNGEKGTSLRSTLKKSGPRFNNIFYKILREYESGKKNSMWKETAKISFKLKKRE